MITVSDAFTTAINSNVRSVKAKVEYYQNAYGANTPLHTYTQDDAIKSIEIQRTGEESKFFGFGISHRVNIKLIDVDRKIDYSSNARMGYYFRIHLGVVLPDGTEEYVQFPKLYISEINRDETTNELSITAYDALHDVPALSVSDLELPAGYSLEQFTNIVMTKIDNRVRELPTNYLKPLTLYKPEENPYCTYDSTLETITVNGEITSEYDCILVPNNTQGYVNIPSGRIYTTRIKVFGGSCETSTEPYFYLGSSGTKFTTTPQNYSSPGRNIVELHLHLPPGVYNNYQIQLAVDFSLIIPSAFNGMNIPAASLYYPNGANLEGTENLRVVLNAIAEATQTVYYINGSDVLQFKRLDTTKTNPNLINKSQYITFNSGTNRRLQTIVSATELGDNVSASTSMVGTTQYVRDNPFWELRDDIAAIVERAVDDVGNMTIGQVDCTWRGNPSLEIGDTLAFTTKDGADVCTYLINDTITYNGSLSQKTSWKYTESEESYHNPTSLGEALKQTYAKVDKQKKEIEIVASESNSNTQELAALKINTESISASVSKVEEANTDAIASINGELVTLTKKVEATMTSEDVQLQIKSEISNGVDKVTTATGFTFNEEGLTIAKTGSEMTTNIDEDGMSVFRDNQEVLTADNTGVTAYNLKARTYLIVGENSRFEDFTSADGEQRTGCFWIGG